MQQRLETSFHLTYDKTARLNSIVGTKPEYGRSPSIVEAMNSEHQRYS